MHDRIVALSGLPMAVDDPLAQEFEARLAETSTLAFRVAYSVLRHREEAEEVAQDAFLRAYRRFAQLRDRTRFRAWLARITWRLALDRQRASRRRAAREQTVVPPSEARPAFAEPEADRAAGLWAAIDGLPDRLRWPLVLAAIEGYDMREVAALLQVPEGTIKSRLFEARRRLKERLS
jgi:RNA polymerase sigma-70 factor (ECF subfamily)